MSDYFMEKNGENKRQNGQTGTRKSRDNNTILVVEDDRKVRTCIREILRPDYSIMEAADGFEGIQAAKKIIPDLIVSDIMMPKVDGYTLCIDLKTNLQTCHIPIVLLTIKKEEEDILKGLENGADDYIGKPFSTRIFTARIKNLLHQRRQLQQKIKLLFLMQTQNQPVLCQDEAFLKEVREIIETNLSDPEFDVEELCKKLFMSQPTLYRKIKTLTGESPTLLIQSCRLHRAEKLLKNNFGNVTEVAFEVGFSSSAYFTRCFREKFNCLPNSLLTDKKD